MFEYFDEILDNETKSLRNFPYSISIVWWFSMGRISIRNHGGILGWDLFSRKQLGFSLWESGGK